MSKTKTTLGLVAVFATSAVAGFLTTSPSVAPAADSHRHESPAIWRSGATTPAQLLAESDLVVRVQVLEQDAAFAVVPAPFRSPAAAASLVAQGRPVPRLVFTPSVMEVLEVYHGAAAVGDRVKVMQTGGLYQGKRHEIADDPLYSRGGEHVLFLRSIANEGAGEATYVTINPAARYEVAGEQLVPQASFFAASGAKAPADLASLLAQLQAAKS